LAYLYLRPLEDPASLTGYQRPINGAYVRNR